MTKNKFYLLSLMTLFFLANACKEQYPDLEDGLYAQFVTNKDTMVAKLYFKEVPVTVANFVALAEGSHPLVKEEFKNKKYYNGTTFHRVMDGFMIQGGDPTATGSGNPGYKFEDEFSPELKHSKPGILSMANSGPNTNGSQFFITEKETPFLDAYQPDGSLKKCGTFPGGGCHAVFGELVYGLNVQDSISNVEVAPGSNKPIEDVVILELNIIRKGKEAKNFKADKVFTEELPKLKEAQAKAAEEAQRKAEEAAAAKKALNATAAAEILPTLNGCEDKSNTLASGLKYYTIKKGNGTKPKSGSTVNVNYEGYFVDGLMFDSNVKDLAQKHGVYDEARDNRGMYQPSPMPISPDAGMIAGFKEGLAKMEYGEKAYFYIPSHLAWGERGAPPVIPPNSDVIFLMEIVADNE